MVIEGNKYHGYPPKERRSNVQPFKLIVGIKGSRANTMYWLVSRINSLLLSRILKKITAKECPKKIERLWEDRQKEDCYFTSFEFKDKPLAVLWGYSEQRVRIRFFSDNKYSDDEKQLLLEEIPPGSLQVNHYFHGYHIQFNGIYHWLIISVFPWPYIRIRIREIFGAFMTFWSLVK